MSTKSDDLDVEIDAWTQEYLAVSPAWPKEKWAAIEALLESGDIA
ncbi:hypothetical protein [Streptomyces tubercidicus]